MTLNGESLWGAVWKAVKEWWAGKRRRGLSKNDYRVITLLALLPMVGCTSTYVHHVTYTPDGKVQSELNIHRRTCISKVSMPEVEFATNGMDRLKGYENDGGNGVVAGAVEAACKGAVKGAVGK